MAHRLFIDGTDRIDNVPIKSISVTEAGPGGVSSMEFTLWDPTKALTLARFDTIGFDTGSIANRLFYGYVIRAARRPAFATGRTIDVTAVGVEVILDWRIAVSLADSGSVLANTISTLSNAATSVLLDQKPWIADSGAGGPIASATRNGNATVPIGTLDTGSSTAYTNHQLMWGADLTSPASTLRQAIEFHRAHSVFSDNATGLVITRDSVPLFVTVSHNDPMSLRVWEDGTGLQPDDWTTLTVTDTVAGTIAATEAELEFDYGDKIDRVYVDSSTAGGDGFVGTSAWPNHEALVNDDEATNATTRTVIATNYIDAHGETVAGTLTIAGFTPATTVHAGGLLTFTDAGIGASGTYRISEIKKSNFEADGQQDWEVSFGLPPRRLTREVGRARRRE